MAPHLCPSSFYPEVRLLRNSLLSLIDSQGVCMHVLRMEKGAAFLSVCMSPTQKWGVPVKTCGVDFRPHCGSNCLYGGWINQNVEQSKACRERWVQAGVRVCGLSTPKVVSPAPLPQGPFLLQNVLANGQEANSHGKNYEKWDSSSAFPSSPATSPGLCFRLFLKYQHTHQLGSATCLQY